MTHSNVIKRSSLYTALIAGIVIFSLGLGHRALEARYGYQEEVAVPIDSNALARLPMTIGNWIGHDAPLDEHIVERADIDAYVNRFYSRNKSRRPILLYIGCGSGVSVANHYPNVCYRGNGWIPRVKREHEISLNSGLVLPYNLYKFTRGDPAEEGISLFQFFVADGDYYAQGTKVRRRSWGSMRSASYFAQVQIAIRSDPLMDVSNEDSEILLEFTKELLPHMNRIFTELLEKRKRASRLVETNED